MRTRFRLLARSFPLVLALLGSATAAAAIDPPPRPPLVHLHSLATFCDRFTGPVCDVTQFQKMDVFVYRDGRGIRVLTTDTHLRGLPGERTPPLTELKLGKGHPSRFVAVVQSLGAARIGFEEGACNPCPACFERGTRTRIAWYGVDFRRNVIDLGSEFDRPCPPELLAVVAAVGDFGSGLELADVPGAAGPAGAGPPSADQ